MDVLFELERTGTKYTFIGEDELKLCCPFHDDNSPSCHVNTKKAVFKCHTSGCEKSGDFYTFLAAILKTTRRVIVEDINNRYGLEDDKILEPSKIEREHNAIWQAKPLLKELHNRGIGEESIRKYRLGYADSRITIPIKNSNGHFVNVRKYSPGAPGKDKFRNTRGRGKIRLFPIEQLKYDTIVICGGELKAILVSYLLNPYKIGAISTTAGESNWNPDFSKLFKNKKVYVLYDIDKSGVDSAEIICAYTTGMADWVGKVILPLDIDKYPHGDVNDWVGLENATAIELAELLIDTKEWKPLEKPFEGKLEPTEVSLMESVDAVYTGQRIRLKATVCAMDTTPYVIPKKVKVDCDKNQQSCALCPIFPMQGDSMEAGIPDENPAILDMISSTKAIQQDSLREALSIPPCKSVAFAAIKYYNAEDVRLSPQLEITSKGSDKMMQPAVCLGTGLELNESYELTGRMFPHPKTQQSVLLISQTKPTTDALSNYKATNLERLIIFQPDKWTVDSIKDKLSHIYEDLAINVTKIYERQKLHLVMDLAYHSPLLITFDNRVVKGWTEVLIVGDSSQGKSETAIQLMQHYGLGEKVECKNATVAGLLGGLQQMSNKWFVSWGVIPTHDRRLVVLEETKGTSTEVIGKLTDMRSRGIAEIPKIEKRRAHARTRLIWLSNPRSDMPVDSYSYGIQIIKELIGGLEDVRRFDLALIISANEVDVSELQRRRSKVSHIYTNELCRKLILWAWTREPDEVMFEDEKHILEVSSKLCGIFSETIPLVDRGSMRHKIARLAASLACRTFSMEDDKIVVRKCHIEYISELLQEIYSTEAFGYLDYSNAIRITETLKDPQQVKTKILQSPFPRDLAEQLLHSDLIEFRDISDWCGWERGDTLQFISFMVRKHAFRRDGRAYRKVPAFIYLLKDILASDAMKNTDKPEHIGEQF